MGQRLTGVGIRRAEADCGVITELRDAESVKGDKPRSRKGEAAERDPLPASRGARTAEPRETQAKQRKGNIRADERKKEQKQRAKQECRAGRRDRKESTQELPPTS
jgi:hypothetical protein